MFRQIYDKTWYHKWTLVSTAILEKLARVWDGSVKFVFDYIRSLQFIPVLFSCKSWWSCAFIHQLRRPCGNDLTITSLQTLFVVGLTNLYLASLNIMQTEQIPCRPLLQKVRVPDVTEKANSLKCDEYSEESAFPQMTFLYALNSLNSISKRCQRQEKQGITLVDMCHSFLILGFIVQ